jgi:V/A-type H+-transporting ATPase subunit A
MVDWYRENVDKEFPELRQRTLTLLQEEAELNEVVQLVGVDGLSFEDRLKLEVSKSIREDYLHQNAFHDVDTYSSTNKQYKLLKLILSYFDLAKEAVEKGANFNKVAAIEEREAIGRFKYIEEANIDASYEALLAQMKAALQNLVSEEERDDD